MIPPMPLTIGLMPTGVLCSFFRKYISCVLGMVVVLINWKVVLSSCSVFLSICRLGWFCVPLKSGRLGVLYKIFCRIDVPFLS